MRAGSTAPTAGNGRGCPCFAGPAACTWRSIATPPTGPSRFARGFGTRGRVLIPPEDLGPKGDPAVFRSILERALATSPTPWALQIQQLASDLAPWDLEDHAGVRDLLCEIGHQAPLSRDAHLRLLAERCGVALSTLQEAARELAHSADAES